jgi:hypothetical protein
MGAKPVTALEVFYYRCAVAILEIGLDFPVFTFEVGYLEQPAVACAKPYNIIAFIKKGNKIRVKGAKIKPEFLQGKQAGSGVQAADIDGVLAKK